MATEKSIKTAPYIPPEEDPKSPFEGLFHLLRRCVHGHDTDIESICHYQDVFGHSCEEDHEKAAEGEYKETFYRLYQEAYGTIAVINFDRKHSVYCRNLRDQIEALESDIDDHLEVEKDLRQKIQSRDKDIADAAAKLTELYRENDTLKKEKYALAEAVAKCGNEIVRLKAQLFDTMEARG